MNWMSRAGSALLMVCCAAVVAAESPEGIDKAKVADSYDIVIYGPTSAGVIAAVQARAMDKSVVIVGPDKHLGGLSSSGLGRTDSGRKAAVGGLSREFYHRVWKHYARDEAWRHQTRADYITNDKGISPEDDGNKTMWNFEPRVAEGIFEEFVKEYQIPVFRDEWLDREAGVTLAGKRITAIRMLSGKTFRGKMFIDATYEGDLMAAAGVKYTVGREANAVYGEFLNGVQKAENKHNHSFVVKVDPYRTPGDPRSGLVWGVHGDDPGEEGSGDHRVQAYCYRMCMSNVPENSLPFPKPADYDEAMFELLFRNFEAGDHRVPMHPGMMPNGKTDTNNNHAFSTDAIGLNYEYPEASYEQRARILKEHETYQKGLMWSLANHPRVPEKVRAELAKWGLAKDEFVDNGHWPHQIYVREARRMIGAYVQTELDCRRLNVAEDSVGLGSYNMDSHNAQRYVTKDGIVQNEGDVQVGPGGTYAISYRALTPKRDEVENLLVPVCLSSSHIAYGSIRMEPVFMILGQSAATAAAMAIDAGQSVQEVPYAQLRERLQADGQQLDVMGPPKRYEVLSKQQLEGIIVDDSEADLEGFWKGSSSSGLWVERGYLHDGNEGKGERKAVFATALEPGRYEVRLSYPVASNRARAVPVAIHHADGVTRAMIDQQKEPPIDGLFVSLGTFEFGKEGRVEIRNEGTQGHVVIDAVQFLKKGSEK